MIRELLGNSKKLEHKCYKKYNNIFINSTNVGTAENLQKSVLPSIFHHIIKKSGLIKIRKRVIMKYVPVEHSSDTIRMITMNKNAFMNLIFLMIIIGMEIK